MGSSETRKHFSIGEAATYRVVVQGIVGERFTDLIGEMQISTSDDDGAVRTAMEGRFRDQAQLVGLLSSLYEWHLPIVSVELLALD